LSLVFINRPQSLSCLLHKRDCTLTQVGVALWVFPV